MKRSILIAWAGLAALFLMACPRPAAAQFCINPYPSPVTTVPSIFTSVEQAVCFFLADVAAFNGQSRFSTRAVQGCPVSFAFHALLLAESGVPPTGNTP